MARRQERWRRDPFGVLTDGRFTIVREEPQRLRDLGVPAFFPWVLLDRDTPVDHYPNAEQAQRYAESMPKE